MPPHLRDDDAPDDELVSRVRAGDQVAYGELVRRHQAVALRLAAGICGSTEEARDIVQDGFVQGYRSLHRYRGEAPVRSWLLRIVANTAKNSVRSQTRRRSREDRSVALDSRQDDDPVGDAVTGTADAARQLAALRTLAAQDREVLAARYLAGLSEAETAALLDVPVGTVKSRANRAVSRARVALEVGQVSRG